MKYSVNKNIVPRRIDGKYYIVEPGKQILHSLNETGTFIFSLLKKEKNSEKIVKALCREFDVDKHKAEEDLKKFIDRMKEKEIIRCKKD
ncbi:MAG: PqqD family protein [Elusimicrobiota bacterium]